jgi:tetratricopeptide (TPR) repeat protein
MSAAIKVSLCMITKNEEDNITRCINSVRHLVDEIIVVDTGSEDGTIDQVLEAGGKVYPYHWQDDFAEARNYGLNQAAGDWILVLDADEILEYTDVDNFSKLLANVHIEGYFIDIESYIGNGQEKISDQVVRLFRNWPYYRFSGAIHEQVASAIKANNQGQGLASAELKIIHRGYLSETIQAKNKHARNMKVIDRALAESPDNPFLRYSLGIEYIQQGAVASGNAELTKALQHMTGGEGYFHDVVLALAAGLLRTGEISRAKELINNASRMLPNHCELLLKGIAALYDADNETAVQLLQQSITGIEDKGMLGAIHSLCGDIYHTLDYYDRAEREYFAALQIAPQHLYPLIQLIGIKQKGKSQLSWQEVSKFTSQEREKKLQLTLIKQGEVQLALVVALLNMMNQNSGNQALITACDDYLHIIKYYPIKDEFLRIIIEYLKHSGELIRLCARIDYRCVLLPITCNIENIIYSNLDLIIKTLCPTWIPCISWSNMILNVK